VADDELTLAATDRDHRVDGLDAGLQRLLHRLPHDDAGSGRLHLPLGGRDDLRPTVQRTSQRVYNAPDERGAHGHLEHASGAAYVVALLEAEVVAEYDRADVVLF